MRGVTVQNADWAVPAHVPGELVFDYDLYHPPGAERDVQLAIRRLQDEKYPDIFWSPRNGGHWVATRGEDIYAIFADSENFSSKRTAIPGTSQPPFPFFPILSDPPEHTAYRALLNPSFSPKAIGILEPYARAVAAKLVEELKPRGRCEFVADFAQFLPVEVFMTIVDVPRTDRDRLLEWAVGIVRPKSPEAVASTLQEVFDYAREKIADRRSKPGDDLITRLTQAQVNDRPLSDDEVTGMVSLILLGGLDAVVASLSFAALFLARSPQHRRQLVDDPKEIMRAVDEMLRRFPVANTGRVVARDLVYRNVVMKAGDMMLLPTALHGLDERCFQKPLEVNFQRSRLPNSTFGNGTHRCPGQNLARTEVKVFLEEWLRRIPEFRLAANMPVPMAAGLVSSVLELHLEWDAA
jgi:cytochrome P450